MIRRLVRNNPGDVRFIDLENTVQIIDHRALNRDEIYLKTQHGRLWINGAFQTEVEDLEELRTIVSRRGQAQCS